MTPSSWSSPSGPPISVFQADTQDSDLATAQTIQAMCEYIHRAAKDTVVHSTAAYAESKMRMFAVGSGCFWWAKHFVKQLPHAQFKALYAGFPQKRQLLVIPEVVVRATNPAGDCSTFSMLIAAMLESLGIKWELVTVAVEPSEPTLYSHVFVRAVNFDGTRLTLDGSHGKYPGWEVPRVRQLRRQVWDENGNAIPDGAPVLSGLGEYRRMPGLGDDGDDIGGTYTDTGSLPGATDTSGASPRTFELPARNHWGNDDCRYGRRRDHPSGLLLAGWRPNDHRAPVELDHGPLAKLRVLAGCGCCHDESGHDARGDQQNPAGDGGRREWADSPAGSGLPGFLFRRNEFHGGARVYRIGASHRRVGNRGSGLRDAVE